jgi:hypothetical protein
LLSRRSCRTRLYRLFKYKLKNETAFIVTTTIDNDTILWSRDGKVILKDRDTNDLYLNDGDSTTLYYLKSVPTTEIKGVLVILPSEVRY